MDYRNLGLLSFLVFWSVIIYMLLRWRGNKTMSISLHAASARQAYFISATTQTLTAALLYLFMTQWFIPFFKLPFQVNIVVTLAVVLQILASWVHETKGKKQIIHRIFAYTMALLMPVVMIQILLFSQLSVWSQIVGAIALLYMVVSILIFTIYKPVRKYYLPCQIMYVVAFQIFILTATYLA